MQERAEIRLEGTGSDNTLHFELSDMTGVRVVAGRLDSNPFLLQRGNLPAGLYILTVRDDQKNLMGRGKLLME
jgi:hypothetical protein